MIRAKKRGFSHFYKRVGIGYTTAITGNCDFHPRCLMVRAPYFHKNAIRALNSLLHGAHGK